MICKTKSVGINIIFQSTSIHPVFSDTKAKLMERKRQSNIALITILLLDVLILEINFRFLLFSKVIVYFGFMGFQEILHKIKFIKADFLTGNRNGIKN